MRIFARLLERRRLKRQMFKNLKNPRYVVGAATHAQEQRIRREILLRPFQRTRL